MGDRILFTRNDAALGVRNGMLGTVDAMDDGKLTIRLDANGTVQNRKLTFSPRQFPSIDHGFAVSIHRSQGCTVDKSYVLSSRTMDKNLIYVAMTRHRHDANFYTAPEIRLKYAEIGPRRAVRMPSRRRAPNRSR